MKIGDLVTMTGKARRNFYETEKLVECFEIGGELLPEHFVNFVNEYVGFINKNTGLGVITGISICSGETTLRVEFTGPTGYDYSYFDKKDVRLYK